MANCIEEYECGIKALGFCRFDHEVKAQTGYLGKAEGFSSQGFEAALGNYEKMVPLCLEKTVLEKALADARQKASEHFGSTKTADTGE